jgi:hypothetical protein
MKKYLFILSFITVSTYGQRKFDEFPEETDPDSADIVISYDGTRNEKVQLYNLLVPNTVKGEHLNPLVAGDGLVQDASGNLDINTGTGLSIAGDVLSVTGYGSLAGGSPYIFSNLGETDTMELTIDADYTTFDHKGGEEGMLFTFEGEDAFLITGAKHTMYYNGSPRFYTVPTGIRVDSTIRFNSDASDIKIWGTGSSLYFADGETGQSYSLLDLATSAPDLSGLTDMAVLFNSSGSIAGNARFTWNDTWRRVNIGLNNSLSNFYSGVKGGAYNTASAIFSTVNGGGYNTASGEYSTVPGGRRNTASGSHSFASGDSTVAHDFSEAVFGHFNEPSTGTQTSIVPTNRIFTVGNGTAADAQSNALEIYASGKVYAPDTLVGKTVEAEDSIKVGDTWFESGDIGGGGEADTAGTPSANQLAVFTQSDKIKGEDSINWVNGLLDIKGDFSTDVIKTSGSTKTAGYFYTGITNPTNTDRLNYDGHFYATKANFQFPTGGAISGTEPLTVYNPYPNSSHYAATLTSIRPGVLHLVQNGTYSSATHTTNILEIDKTINTGAVDITGNIIDITDNPTTSGTISGKVLTATIGSTERISLNPRLSASSGGTAYFLDTHEELQSGDTIFAVYNNGLRRFSVDYAGNVNISNDLTVDGNTTLGDEATDTTTATGLLYTGNPRFFASCADSSYTVIITQNVDSTFIRPGLLTVSRNEGTFVVQGDSVQVPFTGWGISDLRLDFQGTAVASSFEGGFYVNGTLVENKGQFQRTTTTNGIGSTTMYMEYQFTSGDWIKPVITNTAGSNNATVINIDWAIKWDE